MQAACKLVRHPLTHDVTIHLASSPQSSLAVAWFDGCRQESSHQADAAGNNRQNPDLGRFFLLSAGGLVYCAQAPVSIRIMVQVLVRDRYTFIGSKGVHAL